MAIYYQDEVSKVFRALSDPTRRSILRMLAGRARPVSELVAAFEVSQPTITRHLGVLEGAGLIARHVDGRFRQCQLRWRAMANASNWMGALRAQWEEQLFDLDEVLQHSDQDRSNL
jgi:DNA-binding transcriptional ArsR family regulator